MSKREKGREDQRVGERRESKRDPPFVLVFRDFD